MQTQRKLLEELHGKYKLGVISNFAIPECVLKLLKTAALDGLFDVVVVSGAVNKRKPSPRNLQKHPKIDESLPSEASFCRRHNRRRH